MAKQRIQIGQRMNRYDEEKEYVVFSDATIIASPTPWPTEVPTSRTAGVYGGKKKWMVGDTEWTAIATGRWDWEVGVDEWTTEISHRRIEEYTALPIAC